MSADLKNKKKKSDLKSYGVVAAQVQAVPNSFEAFQHPHPLSAGVLDYVKSKGFTTMTPVQSATLPQFLAHKDVAVQAVTGSGKTLAFLIPMIEMLQRRKQPLRPHQIGGLVLSPTRELAQQTHVVATELCGKCPDLRPPLLLVGGGSAASSASSNRRPVTADLELFRTTKADLIIGCPGRVNDVLSRYDVMDCTELECLVLDEADVLLNMGFSTTLQEILGRLPKMRRTALFSATQASSTTSSLNEWMHRMGMRNPMWIDVKVVASSSSSSSSSSLPLQQEQQQDQQQQSQATPTSLTNHYHVTQIDEKMDRLACFLRHHKEERFIVFFLTCACVDFYGHAFQQLFAHHDDNNAPPFSIELLHGKMVQKRREKTMERFRQVTGGAALFCTDVAARGLDVDNITWVVQVDAPQDPAVFIHRAGRAARAGKAGQSVIFLSPKEESYVDLLRMRNVPLQEMESAAFTTPRDNNNNTTTPPIDDVPTVKDPISANDTASILPMIRNLVLQDRDVLEKGTRAYTSYIRAYKEHQCAFIFRFQSLDLGRLATAFCLLRLPKMPELKDLMQRHKGKLPHFTPAGPTVNIFAIPYADKAREQARQQRLAEELANGGGKDTKRMQAEQRKLEKEQKAKERRQKKNRSKRTRTADDWDSLALEERLHKQMKRGKITQAQLEARLEEGE